MKKNCFEEKVLNCLCEKCISPFGSLEEVAVFCKNQNGAVGVAVSGGADSVSLLISLSRIFNNFGIPIKVISVNHFIRPDEETCGDALFVEKLCENLKINGYDVSFYLKELERGLVQRVSDERKMGIEEAARFLRYDAFEEFIEKENLIFLCLAHNKNDFYETVLMRFLQGSSCDSSSGILYKREKYIRPLLDVERNEIEDYLKELNQTWRTDKTNFDDAYLRNKIRGKLVPFLDENFDGWKTAVTAGAKKALDDSAFIGECVDSFKIEKEISGSGKSDAYYIQAIDFFNAGKSVQNRLLLKMCNLISENSRIPYKFLCEVCSSMERKFKNPNQSGKTFEKYFADCRISLEKNRVYVRKNETVLSDFCFSVIIEETGFYEYDWGSASVEKLNKTDCKSGEDVAIKLKYLSGREEKIICCLPYQLIVNHC